MTIQGTLAVSYQVMEDYLRGSLANKITSMKHNRDFDRVWIISITNPEDPFVPPLVEETEDQLPLQFHDALDQSSNGSIVLFDTQMAQKIYAFLKRANANPDTRDLVAVNCMAGISRSGAVSSFIQDTYRLDYHTWKRDNLQVSPNYIVLSTLHQNYEPSQTPPESL